MGDVREAFDLTDGGVGKPSAIALTTAKLHITAGVRRLPLLPFAWIP